MHPRTPWLTRLLARLPAFPDWLLVVLVLLVVFAGGMLLGAGFCVKTRVIEMVEKQGDGVAFSDAYDPAVLGRRLSLIEHRLKALEERQP